jgi:C1A family cysteine protease
MADNNISTCMKKLLILLTGFLTSLFLLAQQGQFAPLNPDFVRYQESLKTQEGKKSSAESRSGYAPSPLQLNFANYKGMGSLQNKKGWSGALPSRFDLRDSGFVTSVKNQGNVGTCWAFAAIGSIESSWLVNHWGTFDLSEQNMIACNGINGVYDHGGADYIATPYLTRFAGPVLEEDDPYLQKGVCKSEKFSVPRYVLTSRILPADHELIKRTIMSYGAVNTMMLWGSDNLFDYNTFNTVDYTFYYDGIITLPNHVVLLVGWDDNIIVTGGDKSPKGTKGAWIVKNSWGKWWGKNGYFYLSYYDKLALNLVYHFDEYLDTSAIDNLNMYDVFGASRAWGFNNEVAWGLTRFNAPLKEIVKMIGTYILSACSSIDIEIYEDFTEGKLSGLLYQKKNMPCELPGQRVFEVFAEVEGDYYVKIKYNTPNCFKPIPVETSVKGLVPPQICQTGTNWVSNDGEVWEEIGKGIKGREMDLTIRSYTKSVENSLGFFELPKKQLCLSESINVFSELSDSTVICYWQFLPDGLPLNDSGPDPVSAKFASPGVKKIRLIMHRQDEYDTITKSLEVVSSLDIEINHSFKIPMEYSFLSNLEKPRSALDKSIFLLVRSDADSFQWNYPYHIINNYEIAVTPEHTGQNIYYVTAYQGTCKGSDTISVEGFIRPVNDDIQNAIGLHENTNGPFTNINSSLQEDEPSPPWDPWYRVQKSVWFYFTATRTDSIRLICEGFENRLAVYEAGNADNILNGGSKLLGAGNNSIVILKGLSIDKKYWVQVDGKDGALEGNFNIRIAGPKYFTTSQDTLFLGADSGSFSQIIIAADTSWNASLSYSATNWLGLTPDNSLGKDTVTIFSKSTNQTGKTRKGFITLNGDDIAIFSKKIYITQDFTTGIDESTKVESLLLYPNPASTELYLKGLDARQIATCSITICDITGRVLKKEPLKNNSKIDVSGLLKGLYFLKITGDRNPIAVLRFMKE